MKKEFDIEWEVVTEAPEDTGTDDLQATDYGDPEEVNVEEVPNDEELGADDYSEQEPEEDPENTNPDEELPAEDPAMGADDPMAAGDENQSDEQTDNAESGINSDDTDNESNKYLVKDFIELYNRVEEIIDSLSSNMNLNANRDPIYMQAKENLLKLRDVIYDYITDRFEKESYVSNLYQFNLIIQAISANTRLLSKSFGAKKLKEDRDEYNKQRDKRKK